MGWLYALHFLNAGNHDEALVARSLHTTPAPELDHGAKLSPASLWFAAERGFPSNSPE